MENFILELSIELEAKLNENGLHPAPDIQIIRGGEILSGKNQSLPTFGWFSPTYGQKIHAISIRYGLSSSSAITIISRWHILSTIQDHNRIV